MAKDLRKAREQLLKEKGPVTVRSTDERDDMLSSALGQLTNPVRAELEREVSDLPVDEIALNKLLDNPYQHLARAELDEEGLEELAGSIRQNGFFGALVARRKKGSPGQYELAYGHRRREAARRAGLTAVPVKIVDLSDQKMARIMASENFSRQDLTPLGEANVVGLLYTEQNLKIEEVAEIVGKKYNWVQSRLALFEAPPDIKAMAEQKPDTLRLVPMLAQIKDKVQREGLVREILEKGLTRQQLQKRLKSPKEKPATLSSPSTGDIVTNITKNSQAIDSEISNEVWEECNTALNHLEMEVDYFTSVAGINGNRLTEIQQERLEILIQKLQKLM